MKKMNKKGFTIVELVIVIAVIAILAAVLIPTFSGVVEKANQSAAMQAARNEYTEYMTTLDSKIGTGNYVIEAKQGNNTFYFAVKDGQFDSTAYTTEATAKTAAGITGDLDKTDLSIVYTATEVKSSDLEDHDATYATTASKPASGKTYKKADGTVKAYSAMDDTEKADETSWLEQLTAAYQTFKVGTYYSAANSSSAVASGATYVSTNTYYTQSDLGNASVKIYK